MIEQIEQIEQTPENTTMDPFDNDQDGCVYHEVVATIRRLDKSGVPRSVIANMVFTIGVMEMLREGDTIEQIQESVLVAAANLWHEQEEA